MGVEVAKPNPLSVHTTLRVTLRRAGSAPRFLGTPWLGVVAWRSLFPLGGGTSKTFSDKVLSEDQGGDYRDDGNDEAGEDVVVARREGEGEATCVRG